MIDFETYHKQNPEIWEQFVKFARQTKERGFSNYGAKGLFEIIRWHTGVSGNDGFKINNNYAPDYARKLMEEQPEFKDFFRTREIKVQRISNN